MPKTVYYLPGSVRRYFKGKFGASLVSLRRYLLEASAQLELNGKDATLRTFHGVHVNADELRKFAELLYTIMEEEKSYKPDERQD